MRYFIHPLKPYLFRYVRHTIVGARLSSSLFNEVSPTPADLGDRFLFNNLYDVRVLTVNLPQLLVQLLFLPLILLFAPSFCYAAQS